MSDVRDLFKRAVRGAHFKPPVAEDEASISRTPGLFADDADFIIAAMRRAKVELGPPEVPVGTAPSGPVEAPASGPIVGGHKVDVVPYIEPRKGRSRLARLRARIARLEKEIER